MAYKAALIDVSAKTAYSTDPDFIPGFTTKRVRVAVIAAGATPVEISLDGSTFSCRLVQGSGIFTHTFEGDIQKVWVKATAAVANTFVEVLAEN